MTVIAVIADTHATTTPDLSAAVSETLAEADFVIHAGDLTTQEAYETFERWTDLVAVHGNSDVRSLTDRLPAVETVEYAGMTIVVTHGHDHDRTSLPLLARERHANLAVVGHTHQAGIERLGPVTVLNPGSHADPRGGTRTFATLSNQSDTTTATIRTTAGEQIACQRIEHTN